MPTSKTVDIVEITYAILSISPSSTFPSYKSQYLSKLTSYEDAEEQGLLLRLPCRVGDVAYIIDKDENGHMKVYKGVWNSVSLTQRKIRGYFELCGHVSYDVYDFFYDDGRTMKHGMYVGQESTKFGKVVFLTRAEAEKALEGME